MIGSVKLHNEQIQGIYRALREAGMTVTTP